jgi:hypothetical protein
MLFGGKSASLKGRTTMWYIRVVESSRSLGLHITSTGNFAKGVCQSASSLCQKF